MNYQAWGKGIAEWPKWVTTHCPKCGELVPRGHEHRCDTKEDKAAK